MTLYFQKCIGDLVQLRSVRDVFIIKISLEIAPSLQSCKSEILYAFNYINRYYGMSIDNAAPTTIRYGGPSATSSAKFLRSIFFRIPMVFLIKSQRKLLSKLWPRGTDFEAIIKKFDFIGLIFFMLSLIEEEHQTNG